MINHFANWKSLPIAVIDTETTGFRPDFGHRVVQIAVARVENLQVVGTWSTMLDPQRFIPPDATRVHGISDDMVRGQPTFLDAIQDLMRITYGTVPCAYNADFDRDFVKNEWKLAGMGSADLPLVSDEWHWIDPLEWVRHIIPVENENSLFHACARLGVTLTNAHSAEADAKAAAEVLIALADRIGDMTVSEMIRRQWTFSAGKKRRPR